VPPRTKSWRGHCMVRSTLDTQMTEDKIRQWRCVIVMGMGVKLTAMLISVLFNVLYCLENAFVSCRLCMYICYVWLSPWPRWGTSVPRPLRSHYLQILATPLYMNDRRCCWCRLGRIFYDLLPSDVEQCVCGTAYTGLSCEVSRLPNSFHFRS